MHALLEYIIELLTEDGLCKIYTRNAIDGLQFVLVKIMLEIDKVVKYKMHIIK